MFLKHFVRSRPFKNDVPFILQLHVSHRFRMASPTPVIRNLRTDGKVRNNRSTSQNMCLIALHHLHNRKKSRLPWRPSTVGAPCRVTTVNPALIGIGFINLFIYLPYNIQSFCQIEHMQVRQRAVITVSVKGQKTAFNTSPVDRKNHYICEFICGSTITLFTKSVLLS